MAAHHLTVAKATFAASLLRPDVTRISRDEVAHFHTLLEQVVHTGTTSNIQICKQWLLEHIVPSPQRLPAFVKYASLLANSAPSGAETAPKTSQSRQNLHIIYLLYDVLHHIQHHSAGVPQVPTTTQALTSNAIELFRAAASGQKPRVCSRLRAVIHIWEDENFLSPNLIAQVKQALENPAIESAEDVSADKKARPAVSQVLPYIMPPSHGDPGLPFYELPAGNFMPHMIPNKSIAMRGEDIRPLQFKSGPADEELVKVVKDFLKDVDRLDDPYEYLDNAGIVPEVDDLGQISYTDLDGDLVEDTYYGWSRAFCERMQKRQKATHKKGSRSRSRSYSSASTRSGSPYKRRRLSSLSDASSRDNDRRPEKPELGRPARKRSRSITPPAQFRAQPGENPHSNGPQQSFTTPAFPPPMQFPLGPNGLPLPPPRPPNWRGPWPPPLPPPPPPPGYPSFHGPR